MIEEFIYTWWTFHSNKEFQHKYMIEYKEDAITEIGMTSDGETTQFTTEFNSKKAFDIYLDQCRKSGAKFQEMGSL